MDFDVPLPLILVDYRLSCEGKTITLLEDMLGQQFHDQFHEAIFFKKTQIFPTQTQKEHTDHKEEI